MMQVVWSNINLDVFVKIYFWYGYYLNPYLKKKSAIQDREIQINLKGFLEREARAYEDKKPQVIKNCLMMGI